MGAGIFGAVITGYKAYNLRNLPGHSNLTSKCSILAKHCRTKCLKRGLHLGSWTPITIWNTWVSSVSSRQSTSWWILADIGLFWIVQRLVYFKHNFLIFRYTVWYILTYSPQMFVLIITASVPTLQPLFRSALGIRSTAEDYNTYSLRPTPQAKASRGSRGTSGRRLEYPGGTMNTSVDHILSVDSDQPTDVKSGIVKTNDFTITYHTTTQ